MSGPGGRQVELRVEALGSAGDGMARTAEGRVFVPFALPGELWRVRLERRSEEGWRGVPLQRLEEAGRAEPPCRHFGRCGGCRLQHLPPGLYRDFKRDRKSVV